MKQVVMSIIETFLKNEPFALGEDLSIREKSGNLIMTEHCYDNFWEDPEWEVKFTQEGWEFQQLSENLSHLINGVLRRDNIL